MVTIKENVKALNQEILNGNILGAFDKYYAENCTMQENDQAPRKGKVANREYEEQFVNSVEEWHGAEVRSVVTNEETGIAATEWFMDFTFKGGQRAKRNQVSIQQWKDGKIVSERFYYGS